MLETVIVLLSIEPTLDSRIWQESLPSGHFSSPHWTTPNTNMRFDLNSIQLCVQNTFKIPFITEILLPICSGAECTDTIIIGTAKRNMAIVDFKVDSISKISIIINRVKL